MDYTFDETIQKLKIFVDKMGSDYFPSPVLLTYFETATWDFIGERVKHIEKTQEITDDIRNLIVPGNLTVIEDPNDTSRYIASLPVNYHRLISYDVLYADDTRCRRADLLRQAEYQIAKLNPNKKPTKQYPIILQEDGLFQVDAGVDVPSKLLIKYCKKPTFATTGQPTIRIVNLPDDSIENILLKVVTKIYNKTDDKRIKDSYQLEQAFRKVFK